jgi:hypothetical protein
VSAAEEGEEAMTWHPVTEKPKEDRDYLVFMPERSLDRFSVQGWDHREDSFSNDFGITHWMELPPEPGDEE